MNALKMFVVLGVGRWTAQATVVDTAQGKLRGVVHDTHVSFTGIPYSTVNAPQYRFKRGGEPQGWRGVREARGVRAPCSWNHEECLQLDIHAPLSGHTLPVLLWVHGGTGPYHPANFVQLGVIVIMLNYRPGALGFLCSDEETAPGNAGAKDVVVALRWVRDNIVAFRGNPAKVVVAGQSFGAAIVDALTLSPMAVGLFHGAIVQSGSALCPWAFNYDAKERAHALLSQSSGDDDVTTNIEHLAQGTQRSTSPYLAFGMCSEHAYEKEERFLSAAPIQLLKNYNITRVPLLIGYNSDEAYIFVDISKRNQVMKRLKRSMSFLLPEELLFLDRKEFKETAKDIKDAYFNNFNASELLKYYRDAYFTSHIYRSARLHAAAAMGAHVYYYEFSHRGRAGVRQEVGFPKEGAAHSDELHYLFPVHGHTFHGQDRIVQQRLTTLWINFIIHLNPTPAGSDLSPWEPLKAESPRVYMIGTEEAKMHDYSHAPLTQIWDHIYDKYYYSRQNSTF